MQEIITRLLDDILQLDKAAVVLFQARLHSGDGFFDGFAVFPGGSRVGFGANQSFREDRSNERKRFFPLRLGAQNPSHCFAFAAPLPIPMILRAAGILADLFPGRPNPLCPKFIQGGPQQGQHLIHDGARGIQ